MAYVAAGVALFSAVSGARAAKKQGANDKRAADANAENSRMEGMVAQEAAFRDEEAQRRDSSSTQARSRALLAEAGLSNDGSSAAMIDQGSVDAELDALNIRYGGSLAARGLLSQSTEYRRQGREARSRGGLLAGAALLQGLGNAYGAYSSIGNK